MGYSEDAMLIDGAFRSLKPEGRYQISTTCDDEYVYVTRMNTETSGMSITRFDKNRFEYNEMTEVGWKASGVLFIKR